jgi:hypothetical protein
LDRQTAQAEETVKVRVRLRGRNLQELIVMVNKVVTTSDRLMDFENYLKQRQKHNDECLEHPKVCRWKKSNIHRQKLNQDLD